MIKYNDDNTFVSRSFGFYPHKKNILSATPLHASSPSVFKDDALHDWDEVVGKFISYKRFQKVLEGKFGNIDTDCHAPLFVSANIPSSGGVQ